jgi:hypothetical protein
MNPKGSKRDGLAVVSALHKGLHTLDYQPTNQAFFAGAPGLRLVTALLVLVLVAASSHVLSSARVGNMDQDANCRVAGSSCEDVKAHTNTTPKRHAV